MLLVREFGAGRGQRAAQAARAQSAKAPSDWARSSCCSISLVIQRHSQFDGVPEAWNPKLLSSLFWSLVLIVCSPGLRAMATETENFGLAVLPAPGSVTIDGRSDDWDLSGGMFVCGDVEFPRHDQPLVSRHVRRRQPLPVGPLERSDAAEQSGRHQRRFGLSGRLSADARDRVLQSAG